jgi:hypothetical protein
MLLFLLLPISLLIFMLPGEWWLALSAHSQSPGEERDISTRLIDSAGISFSLIALIGIATFFLGFRFSGWVLWGLAAAAGGGLVYFRLKIRSQSAEKQPFRWVEALPLLAFLAILVFRFYQARELALPPWVDSVHHALLIRIFTATGGLPRTLDPYLPVPLFYHVGLHINAAVIGFFAKLEPAQTLLYFGQLLNAGVSLAIYRLVMAIWTDRRRAIVAMLLTGFVFQMPGYYLTWGRYTLLAGIFLITIAMAAVLEGHHARFDKARRMRIVILTTGLLLTHYYAVLIWAIFLIVYVLGRSLRNWRFMREPVFRKLLVSVGWGTLIALPWLIHVIQLTARYFDIEIVSPTQSIDEAYSGGYLDYLVFLLGPYRSHVVHGLGLLGLGLLGWKQKVRPFTLFIVVFGLFSLPWGINLAPFRPDHGVILAFLPGAIFLADLLVSPMDIQTIKPVRYGLKMLFSLAFGALVIWGMVETRSIINPVTILADDGDLRAMEWIEKNTEETDKFLINTVGWQQGAYRGADGGWWIMPLTGRQTSLPPAIYFSGDLEYVLALHSLSARVQSIRTCDDEFRRVLRDTEAAYVYLRLDKGDMKPSEFISCESLEVVYLSDGVYIFSVDQ